MSFHKNTLSDTVHIKLSLKTLVLFESFESVLLFNTIVYYQSTWKWTMFPVNLVTFLSFCIKLSLSYEGKHQCSIYFFMCLWLHFFFNLLYNFPAQRSAQELPLVEKQSTDSFPVTGGKKMVLTGHNFLQDSKVIFVEKAPGMSSQSRLQSAFPPPWLCQMMKAQIWYWHLLHVIHFPCHWAKLWKGSEPCLMLRFHTVATAVTGRQ